MRQPPANVRPLLAMLILPGVRAFCAPASSLRAVAPHARLGIGVPVSPRVAAAPHSRRSRVVSSSASSFAELRALEVQLQGLSAVGVNGLESFFDPSTTSFALTPGRPRTSVTSTVFSLLAIDAAPHAWREGGAARVSASVRALLTADWRENDVFQAVLVVVALRRLDPEATLVREDSNFRARLAASIGTVLASRPLRRTGRVQPLSAYLRFWLASAAALLLNPSGEAAPFLSPELPDEALPLDAANGVRLTLERTCELAYDDVCRSIAFHAAGDRVTFDVVVLAYSLLTYVLVLDAFGSAAARARDTQTRDAVGTGSSLPPRNERLLRAALRLIFDEMELGLWPAGQPIMSSRGSGNNVGNAFVFSPDLLASLIEVLPARLFRPHLGKIREHVAWLEEHQLDEVLPSGASLSGWRSNHLPPEGGPIGWCTAQALRCLCRMRALCHELLIDDVLAELGGQPARAPDPSAWRRLLDSDLPPDGVATLKGTLEARLLEPLAALSGSDPLARTGGGASSLDSLEATASYSAVLFGPPGTAKTTVVEAIARRLGWGFVTVDTSTFLQDGMQCVAARISHVFERLLQLDRVVVLFDEIEEFALDRSNPALTMESRMLTTAMLTKLADLRGGRRVAFFIATNRLTALDAAVTRPGRFDLQLFVGTPNLPARLGRFRMKLGALLPPVSGAAADDAAGAFEGLLRRRWEEDAMFLTFLETERLAADCAALVGARSGDGGESAAEGGGTWPSLEASFDKLLDAQAATMTVRGTVREDFLESRGLSRT